MWNKLMGGLNPSRSRPPAPAPNETKTTAKPAEAPANTNRAWPGQAPKGKDAAPAQPPPSGFGGVIDTTRPPPSAYLRPQPGREQVHGETSQVPVHAPRPHAMPDAPDQAHAPGTRPGPERPPHADVRAQLKQMSQNTMPQSGPMRDVTRHFQSEADPRLHYGSVLRTDPAPDLQSRVRLQPRRDSISPDHNETLAKAVKGGTIPLQAGLNGQVKMEPHVKASFQLFEAQRKEFVTSPAYAHIPNREKLELGNHFGLDEKNPNRVLALGTGPGPGGSYIGSEMTTKFPPPTDKRILMTIHDHNNGVPTAFSSRDMISASKDRTEHGVPTEGLVNRNPANPLKDKEYALTNGRVETTLPNGKPSLMDRPAEYKAVDNPETWLGPVSNDMRSIPFSVKGEKRYQIPGGATGTPGA